ncbi:cupin domain-containing protein [Nocardia sp. NPDC004750]
MTRLEDVSAVPQSGDKEIKPQARIVRDSEGDDVWPWLVKAAGHHTENRLDFLVGTLGYLEGPPLHVHWDQQDSFYVLDGVLTFKADGEIFDLGPGDFITIPPGVVHTFDNVHKDQPPVRAINIMTPGGYDEALVEFNSLGDKMKNLEQANAVGQKHRVDIVGPPLAADLGLE